MKGCTELTRLTLEWLKKTIWIRTEPLLHFRKKIPIRFATNCHRTLFRFSITALCRLADIVKIAHHPNVCVWGGGRMLLLLYSLCPLIPPSQRSNPKLNGHSTPHSFRFIFFLTIGKNKNYSKKWKSLEFILIQRQKQWHVLSACHSKTLKVERSKRSVLILFKRRAILNLHKKFKISNLYRIFFIVLF